jgi:AraC-like DNA-binding protein
MPEMSAHGFEWIACRPVGRGFEAFEPRWTKAVLMLSFSEGGEILINNQWQLTRGDLAYVHPSGFDRHYRSTATEQELWQRLIVSFEPDSPFAQALTQDRPRLVPYRVRPFLLLFEALQEACLPGHSPALRESLLDSLNALCFEVIQKHTGDPRLLRLRHALTQDMGKDWTRAEMAAVAGMSQEHLRRTCLATWEITPRRLLAEIRLAAARDLLKRNTLTIEHIATMVGFQDPYAFSRFFKRYTGQTPTNFRKSQSSST